MLKKTFAFLACFLILTNFELVAKPHHPQARKPFYVVRPNGSDPRLTTAFTSLVGLLHAFKAGKCAGFKPLFESGPYFDPLMGPNWWEYYFEPLQVGSNSPNKPLITDSKLNHFSSFALHSIDRKECHKLISQHIFVKKHLREKLEGFIQDSFGSHYLIGIHYESGKSSHDAVIQATQQAIGNLPAEYRKKYKIFLASDDPLLSDSLSKYFFCPMISLADLPSPRNRYSLSYELGEKELLECLALSRCHMLIRTESDLSACSEMFNPQLPVVVLK